MPQQFRGNTARSILYSALFDHRTWIYFGVVAVMDLFLRLTQRDVTQQSLSGELVLALKLRG